MKQYDVTIIEILQKTVLIRVKSFAEAEEIAEKTEITVRMFWVQMISREQILLQKKGIVLRTLNGKQD